MPVLRAPSQEEINEYQKFIESNGVENTEANANRLGEPILTTGQQITQGTLRAAFDMVKGQLTYLPVKSAAEQEFDNISALFTQAQLDQFEAWLVKQRLVSDQSDQGWSNRALILQQLRGRGADFNDVTFAQSLGRVANNAQRPLFRKPEPVKEGGFGRYSNVKFEDQGSVSLTVDEKKTWDDNAEYVNGRRRHTTNPVLQEKPAAPTQEFHQRRALAVRGDTHAENQVLSRIFVTSSGLRMSVYSNEVDWSATATAREAELKQMVRAKERGR